jgi:small subunit ribosomal protein S17
MKTIIGKVITAKMKNTVVVEVEKSMAHPVYHKRIRRTKKYHAHNETEVKTGDIVKLAESRPLSKTKKWKVIEIIKSYDTA